MGSEIRALTGIRGVAAVWVMLGHYLGWAPANATVRFAVSHGYIAVDIFMVLSGFVLALTYGDRFLPPVAAAECGRFLWQRLARIYPLYVLTSAICAAMAWQHLPVWGEPALSAGLIAANLGMVQSWTPAHVSLNATGWSISTEWAANLLFPALAVMVLRWQLRRGAVLAAAALAILAIIAFIPGNAGEGESAFGALDWYVFPLSPVRCVTEFILGMFCWRLRGMPRYTSWLGQTPVLLALLFACAVLTLWTSMDIVLVVLVCGLVTGLSYERSRVAALLGTPVLRWLGTISFGIYLWQLPLLVLRPAAEDLLTRAGIPSPDDAANAATMLLVVAVSALSLTYFERPAQRWMRGMINWPAARRAAAVLLVGGLTMATDITPATAGERTEPSWQQRHAAKRDQARRGNIGLVLMGDSITHNYEATGPEPWLDMRPVWTRYYAGRRVLNLGFSGDTTANLLWRLRHGEIDGIAPAAVVVLIGINDIGLGATAAETVAGIEAVVAEVRTKLPGAGVVLLGILPSLCDEATTAATRAVNAALAGRYGSAAVPGVIYTDVSSVFERDGAADPSLYYDPLLTPPEPPVHPSPEGQARMAAAIEPLVSRLLGDTPR
jgi:peptidoglycan/LPS O-acetylase OafA/YrhL/lysophospholipase L1-like esterase